MDASKDLSDLRDAGDAVETLIDLRACLPPGEMLVMMAGKLRDDIREVLGMKRLDAPARGSEARPLSDLPDADLGRLDKAVSDLLGRFRRLLDDPEMPGLLSEFETSLNRQKMERRTQARALIAS